MVSGLTPEGRAKMLKNQYEKNRINASEALEILRQKSLTDGMFYYIGNNSRDGWVEIFKATKPILDYVLTAEQIDALLAEKGLYLWTNKTSKTQSYWVTIRKVPKFEDNLFFMRDENEG